MVLAGIDILAHEELTFIERLRREAHDKGIRNEMRFEAMVFEKGFHGWLERE